MLNLRRLFKNYDEAGSLNAMVNLFGFAGPEMFLTKTGDAGMVLAVEGVDYECLDLPSIDALTKRLESALRVFDEDHRIYQLLFKRNQEAIPHSFCGKGIVDTAIRNRMAYFREKTESLFSLSIFFVVLCPAMSARRSILLQCSPRVANSAMSPLARPRRSHCSNCRKSTWTRTSRSQTRFR